MYKAISQCRICNNSNLLKVLDLGDQTLTGVFPKTKDQLITRGPLHLVKCTGAVDCCGLLQLAHSFDFGEMYGDNYGYRSGLNSSMVRHLHGKVERIKALVDLSDGPVVLDIGSNDGTTLSAYPDNCTRVGIDPTASKFERYYPQGAIVVADFFSAIEFSKASSGRKARVVTSFSMFYDLERPMDFVREVASILDDEGVWVFEQSYMPSMLSSNSYDTVCHEHLEYYALHQIIWMTSRCGLKVIDLEFNDVNGGSFSVMAALNSSHYEESAAVRDVLKNESTAGFNDLEPYRDFERRTIAHRAIMREFVMTKLAEGKSVACLGASTKGNVLLQFCGFSMSEIMGIGEVNPEKFGAFTPGTLIPIIEEKELLRSRPDYLIVLPWHFRKFFVEKYTLGHGQLVFPLPSLEVI